jgi:hypothetical protein
MGDAERAGEQSQASQTTRKGEHMNQLSRPAETAPTKLDFKSVGMSNTGGGGMLVPRDFGEVVAFSELMARASMAIPKHLRDNPGACMAVAMQALRWEMDPFSVANKSYFVNDRLAYEAQLVAAVVNTRAPIKRRPDYEFIGEGADLRCKISVEMSDGSVKVYESPRLGAIPTKNSPLWKSDVQQQLGYFSIRSWARRYCPEVLLGIYTPDEIEDSTPMRDVTPRDGAARLAEKLAAGALAAPVTDGPKGFNAASVIDQVDTASGSIVEEDPASDDGGITLDAARSIATDGLDALNAWMEGLSTEQRQELAPHVAGLMKVARSADELAKSEAAAEDDFPGDRKSSKQK